MKFFILGGEDGHTPVATTMETWARRQEDKYRRVAWDMVGGGIHVSTVFIGCDEPVNCFETMIFEGPHDGHQERCSTWAGALEQHAKVLALAKGAVS